MKLTEEFPMSVEPERPGMYQVRNVRGERRWARWTGTQWNLAVRDFEVAAKSEMRSCDCYTSVVRGWRGLAEGPNKKGAVAA